MIWEPPIILVWDWILNHTKLNLTLLSNRGRIREIRVNMIQLSLNEVKAGMVLARSLVNENGDLLLASGFVINDRIITKMHEIQLSGCWIYEEGTESIVPEEMVNEQLVLQTSGILRENGDLLQKVLEIKDFTLDNINKKMSETSRFRNIVATEKIRKQVQDIMESLLHREEAIINVNSLRTKSGYLYQHALDVTITAILLACKLSFTLKEIEELAMGCLLMDLGQVIIADKIFTKGVALTEDDLLLMKEHPSYGYAILRENEKISLSIAHVAYQHHERQDGNGFPRHLKGDNSLPIKTLNADKGRIHRYAEVASVADMYISLIMPRPNTIQPRTPDEAMRILIMAAGTHLNRSIVDKLVTMIPIFPIGSRVVIVEDKNKGLLTGFSGVVAKTYKDFPERPMVVLIFDREKKKIKPMTVNLAEEKGLRVQFARLQ